MHILLTDILTCPRCGPEFGLIVLADRIDDRQVREGQLGCANCRLTYAIERGAGDMRVDGGDTLPLEGGSGTDDDERAFRAAALLGQAQPNASILVLEQDGGRAAEVARIFPEAHVIGVTVARPSEEQPSAGYLSRIRSGRRLPFRGQSVRGAAIFGSPSPDLMEEVARVLMKGGRMVIDEATDETVTTVEELGLELLLDQDRVVVAVSGDRG